MNKMIFAGFIVAALAASAIGAAVLASEPATDTMSQKEIEQFDLKESEGTSPEQQHLLTQEQIEEMRQTAQELRDQHATRTEIRETVQAMAHDFVQENLESYGLSEGEIEDIQLKTAELMEQMLEIRETAHELWEQDMNRQDIREELQPLIKEARNIRAELKGLLDEHGILPPEIGHPGNGQGPGRFGRPGRFGGPGRFGESPDDCEHP